MKFYIDKKKTFKTILKTLLIAIIGLVILFIVNYFTKVITGFLIVPAILTIPAFIFIITIYRSIWLIRIPEFIINEHEFKCFNILWYNTHKWHDFDSITYFKEKNYFELRKNNGRIIDKIDLSTLTIENTDIFLSELKAKKPFTFV